MEYVDCEPDPDRPPKEPGQNGGIYLPSAACYEPLEGRCGPGSCDFFVTHDKLNNCELLEKPIEIPGGGTHATCGRVESPKLIIEEPPLEIQRPVCAEETPIVY